MKHYDLQSPFNAHVSSSSNIVTQLPGFGNSINTKWNTPSHINLKTDFLGVDHHYHDTSISFQYTEAKIPTAARIDTLMVHSPNRDLIPYSFPPVESDPYRELKRKKIRTRKLI